VNEIFYWYNTSNRTLALRSTHPLTKMYTWIISGGNSYRYVRLTTL